MSNTQVGNKQSLEMASGVEANARAAMGKGLRTLYRVEMFSPWALSAVKAALGRKEFSRFSRRLRYRAALTERGLIVPVTRLAEVLGARHPFVEFVFSQPAWVEEFNNLVVTAGLNDSLDKHFKGSSYTASWFVGLTDGTPTFAAGDTMASHAGWVEVTDYDEATREALTLGTVSGGSVDNSASKASFTINATVTVGGAFIANNSTKGGTTGILYGGGAFAADRNLIDNDVLNVTATLTAVAA